MTKKEINLEKQLEQLKKEENQGKKTTWKTDELLEKVQKLEKKLLEQEEITKKAQHNYIDLKMDFERLVRQTEEKEKNMKTESTINVVKKLLPFIENLRKSLAVIQNPEEDPLTKGLVLMYDSFLKTLEELGIFAIDALGLEPDTNLHAPVGMQPTDDKKLKGKIIEEFERGFIFKKDNIEKVILPSKVIIGQ